MFDLGAAFRRLSPVHSALLVLGAVLAASPAMGQGELEGSFEARLAEAARRGVPALLKIEAEWCVDCQAFDQDRRDSPDFSHAVDSKVLLILIDAEKGSGIRLAENYRVAKYPTFILTDAEGRTMDRWYGYRSPEVFTRRLTAALDDPVPVGRRRTRFSAAPNEADASKLGEIAMMEGYYGDAVAYYRQAGRLGGRDAMSYSRMILRAMIMGTYERVFDLDQVMAEARPILANSELDDYDRLRIASGIARVAQHLGDVEVAREYIRRSVQESQDSDHPKVVKMRARLLPDYALLVEGDPEAAIRYLEESLSDGWKDDARELNTVAWWCFKNQKYLKDEHLAEAERLARRGVELSPAGNARANVLDTLAEICNLRSDCGEALRLIREAIAEDPQNEYFQQQAVRFEEILAGQDPD